MNIEVQKEDIKRIGHTAFKDDDGNSLIICNGDTCNIEEILLRSILKCFGEEYKIVDTEDWIDDTCLDERGEVDFLKIKDVLIKTNLPFELLLNQ